MFRIGVKKSASIDFTPGVDPLAKLEEFARHQGGVWGARRDVVERAVRAMIETAECLELLIEPGKTARVTMTFDEYWLDVATEYRGQAAGHRRGGAERTRSCWPTNPSSRASAPS